MSLLPGCLAALFSLTAAALVDQTSYDAGFEIDVTIGCNGYLYIWGESRLVEVEISPGEEPKLTAELATPQITTPPLMRCGEDGIVLSSTDTLLVLDYSTLSTQMEKSISGIIDSAVTTSTTAVLLDNSSIVVWNSSSSASPVLITPTVIDPKMMAELSDDFIVANSTSVFVMTFLGDDISSGVQFTELDLNLTQLTDVITQQNQTSAYHISDSSMMTFLPDIENGQTWLVQLSNSSLTDIIILTSSNQLVVARGGEIMVFKTSPFEKDYSMDLQNDVTGIAYISSLDQFVYSSGSVVRVVAKQVVSEPPDTLVPSTIAPDTPLPDTPLPTVVERTTTASDESHLAWVIPVVVVSVLVVVFLLYLLYRKFFGSNDEHRHINESLLDQHSHSKDHTPNRSPLKERHRESDVHFVVDDLAPKVGSGLPFTDGLGHPPLHAPVDTNNCGGTNMSTPIGSPIPTLVAEKPPEASSFSNPQVPLPALNPLVNSSNRSIEAQPDNCLIVDTETGVVVGETSPPINLGSPMSAAAVNAATASSGPLFAAAASPSRPALPTPSQYSQSVLSNPSQLSGAPLSLSRQQFMTPPRSVLEELNLHSPSPDIRQIERNFEKSQSPEDHIALVHAKQEENDRLDKVLQLARVGYDVSELL